MVEHVLYFLEKELKLDNEDTIILGNSGGPDSMCLLNILLLLREEYNLNIVCAHVNHNVRVESKKEKEFLMNYCLDKKVMFEAMTIEKYGEDNFHNQARKIRYNFFNDLVQKYNAKYLMTAHHADDLIETILMRIVRGSTLKGYSGFNKISDMGSYKLVRPLIFMTKDEITKYNSQNNVPYVLDSSNFKDKYTRNRYRKSILPFLKQEDKDVHKKFLKFSETLELYDNFINNEISKIIAKVYNGEILNIKKYNELDILIQKKVLYYVLELIYGENLMAISDEHVNLIMELINSKRSNAKISLPNGYVAIKEYDNLIISKDIKDIVSYEMEITDYVILPNSHIIERIDDDNSNNNNICRIDESEVSFPLYVRTRNLGDKMMLKGIDGCKKIKDIFIDCKIPIKDRDKWPIVVDSKGKIIWIPGVKKSKFTKKKSEKYDIILRYN